MIFSQDLEEYDEQELLAELERRRRARARGLCDFCGASGLSRTCRFPARHLQADPGERRHRFLRIPQGRFEILPDSLPPDARLVTIFNGPGQEDIVTITFSSAAWRPLNPGEGPDLMDWQSVLRPMGPQP